MTTYSTNQLANLSGITVRAIQYYDKIGLLHPADRSDKGYRIYSHKELLKLQQILLFKEFEVPLKEINSIVNNPSFNRIKALEQHKHALEHQVLHLKTIIKTVEKTIIKAKTNDKMMTDEEIYRGFTPHEIDAVRSEVKEKWGEDQLKEAEQRIADLGVQGWHDTKKKGEEINQMLAYLMVLKVSHLLVQKAIALHFKHLNTFYEVTKARYHGLAKMYIEDGRFKQHYDNYRPGLAVFIKEAIEVFCDHNLKVRK